MKRLRERIIFITGTDTGVGKTVLTALLLDHLRRKGVHALAMKPFCSGGREDVELLQRVQGKEPDSDQVNPFYFPEPVAPWAAARAAGRRISLASTVRKLAAFAEPCEILLVEGAGGLLSPLGERFSLLDLILRTRGEVIVVAKNQLGTLNHTMLTLAALRLARAHKVRVVLMNTARPDASSRSNPRLLAELIAPIPLFVIPRLGRGVIRYGSIPKARGRLRQSLEQILA